MILGYDYSNGRDMTVLQVINHNEIKTGDIVNVDGSWTENKSLHGKYEVLSIYDYEGFPMCSLVKCEE